MSTEQVVSFNPNVIPEPAPAPAPAPEKPAPTPRPNETPEPRPFTDPRRPGKPDYNPGIKPSRA